MFNSLNSKVKKHGSHWVNEVAKHYFLSQSEISNMTHTESEMLPPWKGKLWFKGVLAMYV